MTKEEFIKKLTENNIDINMVSFNDDLADGYCIRQNHLRWEVLVRERGVESEIVGYSTESDALIYLYNLLIGLYG